MDKIQKIIGNEFKPEIDENGNGYLMLFIATSQQYFLDSLSYDELRIAHILVGAENSLNCPLTIGLKRPFIMVDKVTFIATVHET